MNLATIMRRMERAGFDDDEIDTIIDELAEEAIQDARDRELEERDERR